MSIKKVCKGEIIVLLQMDNTKYVKQHFTLGGELKKHKVIDINDMRDSRTNKYWSSVGRLFEYLVNNESYEEIK